MSYIVTDSSRLSPTSSSLASLPGSIRVGIIVDQKESEELNTLTYLVEVNSHGRRYKLTCQQMSKFGHPYHYEQFTLHKNETVKPPLVDTPQSYATRSGEIVVIAELPNGEGIILGGLKHPSRKSVIGKDSEFVSSFNGIKTEIKKDGSYKLTFNGAFSPAIEAQLKAPLMTQALEDTAAFNPTVAGSYYSFDKSGSYEVSDNSKAAPQSIRIDKSKGTITITSGAIVVKMDKNNQKMEVACSDFAIAAEKTVKVKSQQIEVEGLKDVKIKGAKIAIGSNGVELIDSLIKIIDGIGALTIPHPSGPCSPVKLSPTWAQIEAIKSKLTLIKGSL